MKCEVCGSKIDSWGYEKTLSCKSCHAEYAAIGQTRTIEICIFAFIVATVVLGALFAGLGMPEVHFLAQLLLLYIVFGRVLPRLSKYVRR